VTSSISSPWIQQHLFQLMIASLSVAEDPAENPPPESRGKKVEIRQNLILARRNLDVDSSTIQQITAPFRFARSAELQPGQSRPRARRARVLQESTSVEQRERSGTGRDSSRAWKILRGASTGIHRNRKSSAPPQRIPTASTGKSQPVQKKTTRGEVIPRLLVRTRNPRSAGKGMNISVTWKGRHLRRQVSGPFFFASFPAFLARFAVKAIPLSGSPAISSIPH